MIVSFRDKETASLYHGDRLRLTKGVPHNVERAALRKLDMLNAAQRLDDLRVPPGNRLEALHGVLKGFFSIRVNDQWRIIFKWDNGRAMEVSLTDYH